MELNVCEPPENWRNQNNESDRQKRIRPNKLPCNLPEKEAINFYVNIIGAPPEVEQLINNVKDVASQFLYRWKHFPITLPSPIECQQFLTAIESTSREISNKSKLNLKDLFILPPFDELDAVASDNNGESKKLSENQMNSLRKTGQFSVPSLNFEGQCHLWKLSEFLQKGSEPTKHTFYDDLALAAQFMIVTAKARIVGDFLSVKNALLSIMKGILKFIDAVIGIPSLKAQNLENKVKEERCRYLVAELVCRSELKDNLQLLCKYVKQQMKRAATEKFDVNYQANAQPVPYIFSTPQKQEIDLRLFSKDIMKTAMPILFNILEKETRGWFLPFREKMINELRSKNLSIAQIEEEVNEAVMKEYLQRVYSSILSNSELESLGQGVTELLIQQAQSIVIIQKAIATVKRDEVKFREQQTNLLRESHPVLSRIDNWLNSQLERVQAVHKIDSGMWAPHEQAIKECIKHSLHQTAYFLNRDLYFMRDREAIFIKELQNAKVPTRTFQFAKRIWSSNSWIIKRHFQGISEVIPTVISQQATSIVTPRSDRQPVFLVEKEIIRTTTTRWPCWRILNFLHRLWSYTFNVMFLLLFMIPWLSPIGIRTLIEMKPFMSDLELSQVNGTLFPKKTNLRQTMLSRLSSLWRNISKSRTHFETEPDTGFIGKGLRRHLNQIWNYVIKGFFGTFLIIFILPIVCICACTVSIILGILSPLWIPIATLLLHIYMILIYDFDNPRDDKNNFFIIFEIIFWNFTVKGLFQLSAAVFTSFIICPLISTAVLLGGLVRYLIRRAWDSIVFHVFIKHHGRVPSADTIAVKRISGPGHCQEYFFSITPSQALAALVDSKMELDELEAWKSETEEAIHRPKKDYNQFIEACFGPFSAQICKTGEYRKLDRECQNLLFTLREQVERRKRELQLCIPANVRSKVRMNSSDLKTSIQIGACLLEKIYPEHVMRKLSITEEEFWEEKFLSIGDWCGLASLLYADIFSLDVLTPLADNDIHYKLDHLVDLSTYEDIIQDCLEHVEISKNAPDLLGTVYSPRGNIRFQTPHLEVSAFNPRSKYLLYCRKHEDTLKLHGKSDSLRSRTVDFLVTCKRQSKSLFSWKLWNKTQTSSDESEKLIFPLPIPHPAYVTIFISNRDSDQPIPLDSDLCWEILRSIEECYGDQDAIQMISNCKNMQIDSSQNSLQSSTGDDLQDDSESMRDTAETLPCINRTEAREIETIHTFSSHESLNYPTSVGSNDFRTTEPASVTWTLHNLGASNQFHRANVNREAPIDLASPEDISMDEQRIVIDFKNSELGTNV